MKTISASAAPAPQASTQDAGDQRDKVYYPADTERIGPLTRKLAGNFLLDQKTIWTSPFHINRHTAPWWIGIGAITATLVATDHNTSHLFENSPGQVRWGNRVSNIGSNYTVIPVAAGFYAWGAAFDDSRARETGVLSGEAMLDIFVVTEVLKAASGRNRPNSSAAGEFFHGGAGFPSGHTAVSFALATVIASEYKGSKWVPAVAFGLATVVGGARIAAQQHYASDVFAGGAIGYLIGRYVYQTHEQHALHPHAAMVPIVQPSTGTYGMGLTVSLPSH